MQVSVNQAKEKTCPYKVQVRMVETKVDEDSSVMTVRHEHVSAPCDADRCMMWRWITNDGETMIGMCGAN